ncbi:hypothetical protein QTP88_013209 [Uroleucon formosanum]
MLKITFNYLCIIVEKKVSVQNSYTHLQVDDRNGKKIQKLILSNVGENQNEKKTHQLIFYIIIIK